MTDAAAPDRRTQRNICLLLAGLTTLVYFRVVFFGYIPFDDPMYVQEHPRIWQGLTLENVTWAFTTHHFFNWHPLTWLSYMLDCQIAGPKAGWLHFVNLVFHVANSVLLYLVLARMTRTHRASAFVAFLFALHPLHVESVAWISERKDVLSTLFWILCMGAYTGYARAPSLGRYLLVALMLACGLMSKAMVVTLPCVLLLLDYWPLDRFERLVAAGRGKLRVAMALIGEKLPLLGLSAFTAWQTALAQYNEGAVRDLETLPLAARAANTAITYVAYLQKTFWPSNLGAYYPHPAISPPEFKPSARFYELGIYAGVALAVVSLLVLWFGRRRKYLTVGWLWYLGTLVPVIGLVQVGIQGMADRYTYVPLIGIFIMLAWGVPDLLGRLSTTSRRLTLDIACAAAIAACLALTWVQAGYWRNGIALFSHTIAVTENNVRGHTLLAVSYMRAGEFEPARALFEEANKLDPRNALNRNHWGVALIGLERYEEAAARLRESIALKGDSPAAHLNYGLALTGQEKYEESVVALREAIRLDPTLAKAHNALGDSLGKLKRFDEAALSYQEALRLNPWHKGAQRSLESAKAHKVE